MVHLSVFNFLITLFTSFNVIVLTFFTYSFHSFEGGASGGTLETMFSMSELDLGDDLTDPFLLNAKDSYSETQKQLSSDKVGIAKKNEISAWAGPFIMV